VALVIILAVSKISVDSVVIFCCCCTASSLLLPMLVDDIISSLVAVLVVVVLLRVVRPTVGREGDVPMLFLISIYTNKIRF